MRGDARSAEKIISLSIESGRKRPFRNLALLLSSAQPRARCPPGARQECHGRHDGVNEGKSAHGLAHVCHHHANTLLLGWLLALLALTVERLYRLRYLRRGTHRPHPAIAFVRLLRLSLARPHPRVRVEVRSPRRPVRINRVSAGEPRPGSVSLSLARRRPRALRGASRKTARLPGSPREAGPRLCAPPPIAFAVEVPKWLGRTLTECKG